MKLRVARKIAKRIQSLLPSKIPYDEGQLFAAFMRLHSSWRARRDVQKDHSDRVTFSITDDYRAADRVWSMMISSRYFTRGYRPNVNPNIAMNSRVRRTWSDLRPDNRYSTIASLIRARYSSFRTLRENENGKRPDSSQLQP